MNFETRYKKLNTAQKQAVDTIDGPVMVVAGPGTGKTELLSMRTANILKKTDTLPGNILCLTFTDSGADAMRERLTQIIGQDAYKVAIHTFHSFGTEVINQNSEFFYNGAAFKPADELSSYEVLRGVFDELDYTNPLVSKMNEEYTYLKDTLVAISELKRSGLTSSELLVALDANDAVFDVFEKQLASVFEARVSAATLGLLTPIAKAVADHIEPQLPPEITPFSHVLAVSLTHAIDEAQSTDSTKPITKWKGRWLEKDESGNFVFKSRKKQSKLRAVAAIYDTYITRMQEAELFDFDDMILQVVHTMETQPDLRFNLQEKYQYIMVDEFQDTNMAQARILHDLIDNEVHNGLPNILVVGDDDQAIYAFQGADVSNILNFRAAYPASVRITLADNYRSVAPVLEAARTVITQGSDRLENYVDDLDKTLVPHRKSTASKLTLLRTETKDDERHEIVCRIKAQLDAGTAPESIAVLARRHHELIALLPYFAAVDIAVSYEKRDNVLESDVVQLLETLARIVLAISDKRHHEVESLLPKLLAHPAWQFSASDIWQLSLDAYTSRKKWMEVMSITPVFVDLHAWLIETALLVPHTPLERMLDLLMGDSEETTDFKPPFFNYFFSIDKLSSEPDTYVSCLESLRQVRGKLREYQPDTTPTLISFVSFIELHRATNTPITSVRHKSNTALGAVNLMTAHKSKGQEFETVYITGAIDSAWGEKVRTRSRLIGYPENLPLAPSGATLDERLRLFFVAMTRAKQNLIISYAGHDQNDKEALKASFLLPLTLLPETAVKKDTSLKALQLAAEREWYAPIVTPLSSSMKTILGSTLEQYKLSATHLNNFLDISRGGPQHFLLANLLRFPSAMSPHAAYGSAIHSTLQRAHNHLKSTGEQRPQEDILHDFEQQLIDKYLTPDEFNTFLQKGSDSLRAFLTEKYDSFSSDQKVELSFSHQQVKLGDARLTGALDLVEINETDQTIIVTDYKTGKAVRNWQGKTDYEKIKLHKYKQQLMFYKLLVENSRDFNRYSVESGVLQFVEPTPNGDILALDLSFDPAELKEFSELIQAVWKLIISLDLPDSADFEPSYKGMLAFEQSLLNKN